MTADSKSGPNPPPIPGEDEDGRFFDGRQWDRPYTTATTPVEIKTPGMSQRDVMKFAAEKYQEARKHREERKLALELAVQAVSSSAVAIDEVVTRTLQIANGFREYIETPDAGPK